MMKSKFFLMFGCLWLFVNGFIKAQNTMKWEDIADKLVERMGLQSGETVLLVASPGRFDPLVPMLQNRIVDQGATYLGAISVGSSAPDGWKTAFTNGSKGKNIEDLVEYFSEVDLGVMMPGATPSDPPYKALQLLLGENKGRTIHFHWQGAYDFNGNLLIVNQDIDTFYQEAILKTDYSSLSERQLGFEEAIRAETIRVMTPSGTDISFSIGNRPVTKQNGDASVANAMKARNLIDREIEIPAGAIRVAPLEETINGVIAFPDGVWAGELVKGLKLTFQKGMVVKVEAEENTLAVTTEMNRAGVSGRSFREFALGMNPMLAIPEGGAWIPYYGYGSGVVRLSLGDNTELGGNVSGGYVRWNFFIDATVYVGEEVWVENGKLIR